MRTIKFRGYTVGMTENQWIYGYLTNYNRIEYSKPLETIQSELPVDVDSIGQFTGLYDSEGKEIYEGDIVIKNKDSTEEYAVEFIQGMFMIKPYRFHYNCNIEKMTAYALNFYNDKDSNTKCSKIKVIGNTYESRK